MEKQTNKQTRNIVCLNTFKKILISCKATGCQDIVSLGYMQINSIFLSLTNKQLNKYISYMDKEYWATCTNALLP